MASCEIANTADIPKSSTVTVYVHDDGFGTDLWAVTEEQLRTDTRLIHLDFCLIEVPRAAWTEYLAARDRERDLRHAILKNGGYE